MTSPEFYYVWVMTIFITIEWKWYDQLIKSNWYLTGKCLVFLSHHEFWRVGRLVQACVVVFSLHFTIRINNVKRVEFSSILFFVYITLSFKKNGFLGMRFIVKVDIEVFFILTIKLSSMQQVPNFAYTTITHHTIKSTTY